MTPEERAMLTDLADKISRTPAPAHDPEADEFIRTKIGNRPDALYILTQTTLIQNLAIQHAQEEIQTLKQRAAQPAPGQSLSFLGSEAPSRPGPPAPAPAYSPQPYSASAPPPLPQYAPPPPSEGHSFLRSAAQTAAGVAAGALAFEGIRSLFGGGGIGGFGMPHLGGWGGGWGSGSGGGSFLGGAPGSETIVNNYYDTPDASNRESSDRAALNDADALADSDDRNVSDDTNATYEDTSAEQDDTQSADDTSDDSSSYDDGGSSGGDDSV